MSNLECNIEMHPDWYRDVPRMKTLILGSFPPHKSKWDYPFYYPNSSNCFWEIMAGRVYKKLMLIYTGKDLSEKDQLKAVEERYQMMCDLEIGVQNIGLKIKRKGDSSKDADIDIEEYQDILSIIEKHSELEKILLLGFSAPSSTARAFLKYLGEKSIPCEPCEIKDLKQGKEFFIEVLNKKIKCVVLYSTSGNVAMAGITEDDLRNQFKNHL